MEWVDLHCDVLYEVSRRRRMGERDVIRRIMLQDLRSSGVKVLVCSLFVDDQGVHRALQEALHQVWCLLEEEREAREDLMVIRDRDDLRRCLSSRRIGLVLSMEGAEPVQDDPELLRFFRSMGLSFLALTWSRRNRLADGVDLTRTVRSPGGLSAQGVSALETARSLGLALDLSHLNDPGTEDVIRSGVPILATHSNCRSLCDHPRNLADPHLEAIGRRGGVVGFNAHGAFVGSDDPVEGMYRHISHLALVAGEAACALGLDLCDRFDAFVHGERRDLFMSHREASQALQILGGRLGARSMGRLLMDNPIRVLEGALPSSVPGV